MCNPYVFSFAAPICCSSVRNEECRTACQTVRVKNSKLHIFMLEGQLCKELCKEPREGKNSKPIFLTEGDNSVGILSQVYIQLNPVSKASNEEVASNFSSPLLYIVRRVISVIQMIKGHSNSYGLLIH